MSSYRDLSVYQKSYRVAVEMYALAGALPEAERFGLTSQVKRAATSIPLNIAEGYGKNAGAKEVVRFLQMARGSCAEMAVLIDFLRDFGYITEEIYEEKQYQYAEIGKMLTGLMKTLTNS